MLDAEGEFGIINDESLVFRGFARWAATEFRHMPTKQEVEESDTIWENDLFTLLHAMNYLDGEAAMAQIMEQGKGHEL